MGTVREPLAEGTEGAPNLGLEHPRIYSDLSPEEKDRYNADIRATNILLQGLPKDIYTLINHYTDAKDIWYNVKMLLEGFELTKEDQESQLNIKMIMSRMQLNSKFVNNMLPEWGRFVTAIKLNRGLKDFNYDQLYAYLKQHETHAKENKMILDRFSQHTVDPLALMSNVSLQQHYSPSSSTSLSTYVPLHLAENAHLDLKTFLPQTNNQLRTSSNTRNQAIVQDDRVVVQNVQGRQNRGQGMNPWGGGAAGYGRVQNRVGNANLGQARQVKCYNCNGTWHIARNCTQPKNPQNSEYYKDKMLLMQAQENRMALDAEQLLFLAGSKAQTMFMANLSSTDPVTDEARPSYDLDILSEVQDHNHYQDAICAHHEEHAMHDNVQLNHVVDSHADYTSDSNMIPHVSTTSRNTVVETSLTAELATYNEQVELPKPYYNELNKVAIGYKNPLCLTRAKQVQPALYNGHEIIKDNHVLAIVHNTEDTLEISEITRRKMNDKMKDPKCVTHKTTVSRPIKALTVYPPNTPATLIPRVLSTKSQVKIHLCTLIQLFLEFDKTCKKRITPTGLTEGERGFKQTKKCYLKEVIPFFKILKENFEGIQKTLTKEIKEIKDVFDELKAEVAQNVVDRKCDGIKRKNLLIAYDNLIAECLAKEVFSVATNSELNVARFNEMHVAHTIVEARYL
nr:hypothetical protein [Tanacetum cinerariifolium]